jgi:hypothetical protein
MLKSTSDSAQLLNSTMKEYIATQKNKDIKDRKEMESLHHCLFMALLTFCMTGSLEHNIDNSNQVQIDQINNYANYVKTVGHTTLRRELLQYKPEKTFAKDKQKVTVCLLPGSQSALIFQNILQPAFLHEGGYLMTDTEPKGDLERRSQPWSDR